MTEQIIKGDIAIIKHTDDGETGIETPEEGAEFQIYLKAAGSYDAAKDSERDILVCDENGFAQSKKLPYGTYIVHQTKGWEGRELMDDFEEMCIRDSTSIMSGSPPHSAFTAAGSPSAPKVGLSRNATPACGAACS